MKSLPDLHSTKKPWQEALLPGLFSLGLYLSTLAENYSVAHDSILYLLEVTQAPYFHAHHLLWHWLAAAWLKVWPGASATGLEVLNAFCGAGTVSVSFLVMRNRLGLARLTAWLGSGLVATSYGIWGYSIVIEVYAPALLFFSLTLYEWLRPGPLRPWRLAGWHGLSILLHQSHILLIPLIFFAALRHRPRPAFSYLTGLAVVVGGPYLFALSYMGIDSPAETWSWIQGFLQDDLYWEPPGKGTLIYPFVGLLRSFIGGHFGFALPGFSAYLGLAGQSLEDEAFLVAPLTATSAAALLALSLLWGSCWLMVGMAGLRKHLQTPAPHRALLLKLGLAFLSYAGFFLFWVPFNVEFWLPQLLLLWWAWLALGQAWSLPVRAFQGLLGAMLLCLGGINYGGTIYWLGQGQRDYYQAQTQAWASFVQQGDLVILGQRWVHAAYAEAFSPASTLSLIEFVQENEADTAALGARIRQTLEAGQQVLLTPTALTPSPSHPELNAAHRQQFRVYLNRWQPKGQPRPTPFGRALLIRLPANIPQGK